MDRASGDVDGVVQEMKKRRRKQNNNEDCHAELCSARNDIHTVITSPTGETISSMGHGAHVNYLPHRLLYTDPWQDSRGFLR